MDGPSHVAGCGRAHERAAGDSAEPHAQPLYTTGEEIANAVTHGLGAMLSVAGLTLLVVKAALAGGTWVSMLSAVVFGGSLVLEYSMSALYHAIQYPPAKRVFRILDHSCIYLLIAGSYTPFTLGPLIDRGGLALFCAVWAFALAGIGLEVFMRERQPRWLTVAIYLVMGWLVLFNLPALVASVPFQALALTAAGGACYTVGCAFYLMKRVRYMHSVWHLWVLAGSVCQFLAVIAFII